MRRRSARGRTAPVQPPPADPLEVHRSASPAETNTGAPRSGTPQAVAYPLLDPMRRNHEEEEKSRRSDRAPAPRRRGRGVLTQSERRGKARDAKTKTTIKSRLASEVDASTLLSVEVNVTNGVVTLAGPVHSQAESRKIESVARGVAGVTDVRNDLQVLATETVPTSPAATPPAATPAAGKVG